MSNLQVSALTGRQSTLAVTPDPLAPARASCTLDALDLFDDLEAIVGHSRPFTFAELTDSLAQRRMRKHLAAHARWEAHRLEEVAALEAEYAALADDDLVAIVAQDAFACPRARDAAHAVQARIAKARAEERREENLAADAARYERGRSEWRGVNLDYADEVAP